MNEEIPEPDKPGLKFYVQSHDDGRWPNIDKSFEEMERSERPIYSLWMELPSGNFELPILQRTGDRATWNSVSPSVGEEAEEPTDKFWSVVGYMVSKEGVEDDVWLPIHDSYDELLPYEKETVHSFRGMLAQGQVTKGISVILWLAEKYSDWSVKGEEEE